MAEKQGCPFCGKPVYMYFSTKSGVFEVQHMYQADDKACVAVMPIRIHAINIIEAWDRWNNRVDSGGCECCNQHLGKNLREARLAKGMSVAKVAKAAFISTSSVYGYESGHMRPSADMLKRLCDLLGVTEDFVKGKTDG